MSSRHEVSVTAAVAPDGAFAAGEVLARYLSTQATELLRGLRDLPAQDAGGESGPAAAAGAAGAVHDAAVRIADTLGSFRPLLDAEWAERLEGELHWLGHTVMREHVYAARRDRLVGALRRLSGEEDGGDFATGAADRGRVADLAVGDVVHGTVADAGAGGAGVPGTDRGRAGHVGGAASAGLGGRSRDSSAGYASGASAAAGTAAGDPGSGRPAVGGPAAGGPAAGGSASGGPAAGGGRVVAAGARRAGGGAIASAASAASAAPAAGVARAAALLERRLGLARSRAHSEALDALTSARYHALADAVALLVSDAPLTRAARRPVAALPEHHDELRRVLTSAVAALPLARAGRPYNAAALARGLAAPGRPGAATATAADDRDDAPWRHVHTLVRRARHAAEILAACPPGTVPVRPPGPPLPASGAALDRDREAVEAAAAAASAAATPRIAPATAYALGVLHADQRHEVEAARFTFGRLWQTRGEQR